jgi:hypothetical protein
MARRAFVSAAPDPDGDAGHGGFAGPKASLAVDRSRHDADAAVETVARHLPQVAALDGFFVYDAENTFLQRLVQATH